MPEAISSENGLPLLRTLRRGQTITGTVTEIASFGVTFVDIGGFTAMINIPELSWRPIKHPSDVVRVGQKITAEVLDVDIERRLVPLSLKALQPDPLRELQLQIGLPVVGAVTKITPIGVFVRIEDRSDGFEGLLPQRLLGDDSAVVGEALTVKIVAVELMRRRIELALVEPATAEPADAEPLPDDGTATFHKDRQDTAAAD
jgi:ribosomal protein S1